MRTNEGTCIRDYLKKLTPYIIIWLAGFFPDVDPIQDKKIRLKKTNSAGCRYTTDIICGPPSYETEDKKKNANKRKTDRQTEQ